MNRVMMIISNPGEVTAQDITTPIHLGLSLEEVDTSDTLSWVTYDFNFDILLYFSYFWYLFML